MMHTIILHNIPVPLCVVWVFAEEGLEDGSGEDGEPLADLEIFYILILGVELAVDLAVVKQIVFEILLLWEIYISQSRDTSYLYHSIQCQ